MMSNTEVAKVLELAARIRTLASRRYRLIVLCGGQGETLYKDGLYQLVAVAVEYIDGPGCPVCVIPEGYPDEAIRLALMPGVLVAVHGNVMNIPGTHETLYMAQTRGAQVQMVSSPDEALELAVAMPDREVVYFAIGFETTIPLNARTILRVEALGVTNFSMLAPQVRVPPALTMILSDDDTDIDGVVAAGHVCTVMGFTEYEPIARNHRVPIVVGGFTPLELFRATYALVRQCEEKRHDVENAYSVVVKREGNRLMQDEMNRVFQTEPRLWRGICVIPESGKGFRPEYEVYDAVRKFDLNPEYSGDQNGCISHEIIMGKSRPTDCPLFGTTCTPTTPVNSSMISHEGVCRICANNRSHQ